MNTIRTLLLIVLILVPSSVVLAQELSPFEVYQRYSAAAEKHDIAALKRCASKKPLEEMNKISDAEIITTLDFFYKPIKNLKLVEEKNDGNRATLKLKTIKKVKGLFGGEPSHEEGIIDLVKEKGEWKIEYHSWSDAKEP